VTTHLNGVLQDVGDADVPAELAGAGEGDELQVGRREAAIDLAAVSARALARGAHGATHHSQHEGDGGAAIGGAARRRGEQGVSHRQPRRCGGGEAVLAQRRRWRRRRSVRRRRRGGGGAGGGRAAAALRSGRGRGTGRRRVVGGGCDDASTARRGSSGGCGERWRRARLRRRTLQSSRIGAGWARVIAKAHRSHVRAAGAGAALAACSLASLPPAASALGRNMARPRALWRLRTRRHPASVSAAVACGGARQPWRWRRPRCDP